MRKRNEVVPISDISRDLTLSLQLQAPEPITDRNDTDYIIRSVPDNLTALPKSHQLFTFPQEDHGTVRINPGTSDSQQENANFIDEDEGRAPSKKQRLENQLQQSIQSNSILDPSVINGGQLLQQEDQAHSTRDHRYPTIVEDRHQNPPITIMDEEVPHVIVASLTPEEKASEESKNNKKKRNISNGKQPRQLLHLNIDTQNIIPKPNTINTLSISNDIVPIPESGSISSRVQSRNGIRRRRDQFGTRIAKGSKRHRISFPDQIKKQPLTLVFIVENYKKFNQNQGSEEDESYCHCSVF